MRCWMPSIFPASPVVIFALDRQTRTSSPSPPPPSHRHTRGPDPLGVPKPQVLKRSPRRFTSPPPWRCRAPQASIQLCSRRPAPRCSSRWLSRSTPPAPPVTEAKAKIQYLWNSNVQKKKKTTLPKSKMDQGARQTGWGGGGGESSWRGLRWRNRKRRSPPKSITTTTKNE